MKNIQDLKLNNEYVVELKKIKEGEKISVVSDIMFEAMINNEKRIKYGAYLISKVLNVDYEEILKSIKLNKTTLDRKDIKDKGRRVDFVAEIGDKVINIEMNNNSSYITMIRNFKYATELYQGKTKRREEYDKDQMVIQINLNNFSYGEERIVEERFQLVSDKREVSLIENFQIVNIYLPEIRKKYYNKEEISEIEKLLLVMVESSIKEVERIGKGDKVMEEYLKESIEANSIDDIAGVYDKELDDRMIWNAEKKILFEEGKDQSKEEIAKNLLKMNIDNIIIKEATGLSIDKIKELMNNLDDTVDMVGVYDKELDDRMILNAEKKILFEEGLEQGKDRSKEEIAKKMLDSGEPIEKIVLYTGISKEQLLK